MTAAVRIVLLLLVGMATPSSALVHHSQGRLNLDGVALFQDAERDDVYFYLAPKPRVSRSPDGALDLLCVKYAALDPAKSLGILHLIAEFRLSKEEEQALETKLRAVRPGATLEGPVPLLETLDGSEPARFEVVSSIAKGDGAFLSGRAPVTPGSRIAVATRLSPEQTTLLWKSLESATSDLSFRITSQFVAKAPSFSARIWSEPERLAPWLAETAGEKPATRDALRAAAQSAIASDIIHIESGHAPAEILEPIVDLVVDAMIRDFMRPMTTPQGTRYRHRPSTRRLDIQLQGSSTVKVPVHAAGNLDELYVDPEIRERSFLVVSADDEALAKPELFVSIDADWFAAFRDLLSGVSVALRRRAGGEGAASAPTLVEFSYQDIEQARTLQRVRLPTVPAGRDAFEYRVEWRVRGRPPLSDPPEPDAWIPAEHTALVLRPPLAREQVDIDVPRAEFERADAAAVVVEFASALVGKPRIHRTRAIRRGDPETRTTVTLYRDPDALLAWRAKWHTKGGIIETPPGPLQDDYVLVLAPRRETDGENSR